MNENMEIGTTDTERGIIDIETGIAGGEKQSHEKFMDDCIAATAKQEAISIDDDTASSTVAAIGEEAVVYGKYYFKDLEKYIENIDSVSFIEASSMIKSLDSNMKTLEMVKLDLDAMYQRDPNAPIEKDPKTGKFINTASLGADVATKNLLENDAELAEDAESFYGNYNRNIEMMTKLRDLLQKKVDDAEGRASTKYLNDEMVDMLNKRLRLLNPEHSNYEYHRKRYTNILEAFADRCSITYLRERISNMLRNKAFLRDLKKELADYSSSHLKGLKRIVSAEQLVCVEYYCGCTMFDSTAGAALMVILNKIALAEAKTGKDSWVKVFMLNFIDIQKGFFDLMDANEYMIEISDNIRPIVLDGIKNLKLKPVSLLGVETVSSAMKKVPKSPIARGRTAAKVYYADNYMEGIDEANPEELAKPDTSEE